MQSYRTEAYKSGNVEILQNKLGEDVASSYLSSVRSLLLPHVPYSMNIKIILQWFRRQNNNPDDLWGPGPCSFLLLTNRSMSFSKSWRAAFWKFSVATCKWKFIFLDKRNTVKVLFLDFSKAVATWPQLDLLGELSRRYKVNKELGKDLMMMVSCAESRNDCPREGY